MDKFGEGEGSNNWTNPCREFNVGYSVYGYELARTWKKSLKELPTWAFLIWGRYQFERPYWRHNYTLIQRTCAIPPLAAQRCSTTQKKMVPNKMFHVPPVASNNSEPLQASGYCKSYTSGGSTKTTFFFVGSAASSWYQIAGIFPKLAVLFNPIATRHFLKEKTQNTGTCCFPICNSRFSCANLMQSARDSFGVSNEGMDDPISWMGNMVPN